jgi:TolB protein
MLRLLLAALLAIAPLAARAELVIDITQGNPEPMPIAVGALVGGNEVEARVGRDIARVVSADLERSGLFRPLDPRSFLQDAADAANNPRFPDWRAINAAALVTGKVISQGGGKLRVEFRLWDVFAQQQLVGQAFQTTEDNWRRISHIIADAIYKRITGEAGYFDTRIVYVAESGPMNKRIKRLAVMDQDGANNAYLTDGRVLVLTPRFSPAMHQITYLAYFNNKPRVYLFDIDSGRQEMLGDFPGMTFAPRFSPDGTKVIMSYAKDGNSDIYSMDLRSRRATRLTADGSTDTAPSYSPDGKRIAFESDRSGAQQIYVMGADGGNPQRISFGTGRYGSPVWSPRGDLIAFTKQQGGQFYIGVMRPDGSGERILTQGYLVDGATWAPNGRVVIFYREQPRGNDRDPKLWSIDITGRNERIVPTPGDASDPAWSPLLP